MPIKQITMDFAGQVGVAPRLGRMVTTDLLSTITTPGYLNNQPNASAISFSNGDFVFAAYNDGAGGVTQAMFKLSISNTGVITLSEDTPALPPFVSGVTLGQSESNKVLTLDGAGKIDGTSFSNITVAGDVCFVVPGASSPNKVILLDGASEIDGIPFNQITTAGQFINGVVSSPSDVNLVDNQVATIATLSTTPGVATCDVTVEFRDSTAIALTYYCPLMIYIAKPSGALDAPVTSINVVSGFGAELVPGQFAYGSCDTDGTLDLQIAAAPGSYQLAFVLPNGRVQITDPLVVTGP